VNRSGEDSGHQAVDDFYDIVLLAAHARGFGAMKLLRPLYERVVTALHLMRNGGDVARTIESSPNHVRAVRSGCVD
jgi:hypothetical protein